MKFSVGLLAAASLLNAGNDLSRGWIVWSSLWFFLAGALTLAFLIEVFDW